MNYLKNLISKCKRKNHVPVLTLAVLSLSTNMVTYFGTRVFTKYFQHHDMTLEFDTNTPFIPWTVAIYLGCYLFWIVNYILGCFQDDEETMRFWCADFFAKLVCLAFFVLLPTTNIRPIITDTDIWSKGMLWLYRNDPANNLFPSIHCLTSWFCVIAIRKQKNIPSWYQAVSVIIALSICISTLTTKQHVVVDVFAGIFLAEFAYWFVQKSGFINFYKKMITAINNIFSPIPSPSQPSES